MGIGYAAGYHSRGTNLPTGDFSFFTWLRFTVTPTGFTAIMSLDNNANFFEYYGDNASRACRWFDNGVDTIIVTPNVGEWIALAAVRKGSGAGGLRNYYWRASTGFVKTTASAAAFATINKYFIGSAGDAAGPSENGKPDQDYTRLWNVALTDAEIARQVFLVDDVRPDALLCALDMGRGIVLPLTDRARHGGGMAITGTLVNATQPSRPPFVTQRLNNFYPTRVSRLFTPASALASAPVLAAGLTSAALSAAALSSAPVLAANLTGASLAAAALSSAPVPTVGLTGASLAASALSAAPPAPTAGMTGGALFAGALSAAPVLAAGLTGASLAASALASAPVLAANLTGASLAAAALSSAPTITANLSASGAASDLSAAPTVTAGMTGGSLAAAALSSAPVVAASLSAGSLAAAALACAPVFSGGLVGASLSAAVLACAPVVAANFTSAIGPVLSCSPVFTASLTGASKAAAALSCTPVLSAGMFGPGAGGQDEWHPDWGLMSNAVWLPDFEAEPPP